MALYTKNGRPLQTVGPQLYSRSGKYLGRISGDKVYGRDGKYAGTIVGDRVVYRATDRAYAGSPSSSANIVGTAAARTVGSAIMGDEPGFPD